uniref:Enoyl reductase (ER) domain-containing protein n=1 Tax=Rhodosorus marinus TaxID=101924 RepID=A0A7S2ZRV5_9RHOD|mmetsp:Transcript_30452/g.116678  ORF Transcript_30452/g.116678 Transcript_30452/m.116678 type:complete len:338 (+) Transcript_30452:209-1222(+)
MRAWKITEAGSVDVLTLDENMPKPPMKPTDILVKNKAIGSNPVDYKVRASGGFVQPSEEAPVVLGWDAAGVVEEVGSDVVGFSAGDEVFYAGDLGRQFGSYAEYTPVDYRLVGKKPKTLSWAEAATIPLVAITAWETIKEDMNVEEGSSILIVNGAGGLGSFAIQLAKQLGLTVIATASRPDTIDWCKNLGADHVINHRESLAPQLEGLGYPKGVRYVFHCFEVGLELGEFMKNVVGPCGKLALIQYAKEGAYGTIDGTDCWSHRKTLIHSFMFARSLHNVGVEKQGQLLNAVSEMIDAGKIKHTLSKTLRFEEAKELMLLQESGKSIGKLAMTVEE